MNSIKDNLEYKEKLCMTKYCRNCGEKLKEDDSFCPKCGKTVKEENITFSSNNKEVENIASSKTTLEKDNLKDNKNLLIVCVTIVIAILIIASGVIYYYSAPSSYTYNIDGYNFLIPNGCQLSYENHTSNPTMDSYSFNNTDKGVGIIVTRNTETPIAEVVSNLALDGEYYSITSVGNITGYYCSAPLDTGGADMHTFMFQSGSDIIVIMYTDNLNIKDITSLIVQQA